MQLSHIIKLIYQLREKNTLISLKKKVLQEAGEAEITSSRKVFGYHGEV